MSIFVTHSLIGEQDYGKMKKKDITCVLVDTYNIGLKLLFSQMLHFVPTHWVYIRNIYKTKWRQIVG